MYSRHPPITAIFPVSQKWQIPEKNELICMTKKNAILEPGKVIGKLVNSYNNKQDASDIYWENGR